MMWRLCFVLVLVATHQVFSQDQLPGGLFPGQYTLDLTITEEDLNQGTFNGTVTIYISFGGDVTSFPIHIKELEITSLVLKAPDGVQTPTHIEGPDPTNDFLMIFSDNDTTISFDVVYILTIEYRGKLSDTLMEGFYKSTYGGSNHLLTTYFQETGARRAFPCFDEPGLKGLFTISVTYPNGYFVLSNTEPAQEPDDLGNGLKKVTFLDTPSLPTYLVALTVTNFIHQEGKQINSDKNVTTFIYARPGTEDTMQVALETAPQVLNFMADYTGLDYGYMFLGNFAQVAVPDLPGESEGTWGLPIYRESNLLWDENRSTNLDNQKIVCGVTREVVHQWFGAKMSIDWWNNQFLNDLATYFEYYISDQFQGSWELPKQFVIEEVHSDLLSNSVNTSLPLSASEHSRGTIFRMIQNFLGFDNFKQGIRDYFTYTDNTIGTPGKLWSAFDSYLPEGIPENMETIMDSWINKPGYPILNVTVVNKTVTITQQRFLIDGSSDETTWFVPVTYTTSNNTQNFGTTSTQAWLLPDVPLTLTLEEQDEWIILNNQQVGYYRVYYDDQLLENISKALNSDDFGHIDEISRSQLVDDQFNLARAEIRTYENVLAFLQFLKNDTSYYSWASAFKGFDYLLKRTNLNPLKEYILVQMDSLNKSVPFTNENSTDHIYTLKQVMTLMWACNLDDSYCVQESTKRFTDYVNDPTNSVSPNFQRVVYCTGLRYSTNPQKHYNILWQKFKSSQVATEQLTILNALGCINDTSIQLAYLNKTLSTEIRIQDVSTVFSSVYSNSPEGVSNVLDFITENHQKFWTRFASNDILSALVTSVADFFTSQDQIDKLAAFLEDEDLDAEVKIVGEAALETAKTNLVFGQRLEASLRAYFDRGINKAVINSGHLVTLISCLVFVVLNFN